jgi:hypothetical protein
MDCHLFVQNLEQNYCKQLNKTTDQQNSANLTGTTNHFYLLITVDDDDLVKQAVGWCRIPKSHRRTLAECTV